MERPNNMPVSQNKAQGGINHYTNHMQKKEESIAIVKKTSFNEYYKVQIQISIIHMSNENMKMAFDLQLKWREMKQKKLKPRPIE